MDKEIIKEYTNSELVVVWKPQKCIHAAECVKALPEVYRPNEKPWIKAENASTEALKDQISKCPSGALSYYMKGESMEEIQTSGTKVQVLANGPLLVHGTLEVTDKDGNISTKSKTTAFCRCGASANKPYCDGMHNKVDFSD
ncbi:MAG: (4Fe-4S)-binding protein [Bacteroidota bacterium]